MNGGWMRVPPFAGMIVLWLLLMGEVSVGNVVGGLAVAATIQVLAPLRLPGNGHRVHPVAVARLAAFVGWSLVTSSWRVMVATLVPTPARLRAGIVRVDLPPSSAWVTTVVANAITLTPGTMTLEATERPSVLRVHVLGLGEPDDFREEILELHQRVDAAFTVTEVHQ